MLHPEAERFLDRMKRRKGKSMAEQTPQEARAYVAAQAKIGQKKPQDHLKVTDVILMHHPFKEQKIEDRRQDTEVHTPLRFYRPAEVRTPALILYFHGGGFVAGNCDYVDSLCQKLAERNGALVISVDYHLAPEHPFPFAIYEGLSVLKTLMQHHQEYRFNPKQVILMGDSAGANIAAVITNLSFKEISLHAQVLLYPTTDFHGKYTSLNTFNKDYFLSKADTEWAKHYYLQDLKQAKNPVASPIFAKDLQGLPKTLIITAECDPLRDEGRAYAEHLISFGNEVHYHEYQGMIHCFVTFIDFFPKGGGQALAEIKAFLMMH